MTFPQAWTECWRRRLRKILLAGIKARRSSWRISIRSPVIAKRLPAGQGRAREGAEAPLASLAPVAARGGGGFARGIGRNRIDSPSALLALRSGCYEVFACRDGLSRSRDARRPDCFRGTHRARESAGLTQADFIRVVVSSELLHDLRRRLFGSAARRDRGQPDARDCAQGRGDALSCGDDRADPDESVRDLAIGGYPERPNRGRRPGGGSRHLTALADQIIAGAVPRISSCLRYGGLQARPRRVESITTKSPRLSALHGGPLGERGGSRCDDADRRIREGHRGGLHFRLGLPGALVCV